mgnify:CR=1 FL=1
MKDNLSRLRKETDMIEKVDRHPVTTESVGAIKKRKKKGLSRLVPSETESVYPHISQYANYETASPKEIRKMIKDYKSRPKKERKQIFPLISTPLEEGLNNDRKDRDVATRNEMFI